MADVSTLNGYNLKDAQARSDIATINGKIGSANGIAELDANGRVPSSQLPSYVDDVLEYASQSAFPATGETGKIYIALDTNKTFRWSGSAYVEISESLALGETSSTAYAGNKGKANADAIAAMKDGSYIDSFGDVETALAGKADKFGVDGSTIDWLAGVGIPDKLYVIDHDEIPQENEWINGLPNDEAVRKAVKSAYDLMEDTVGWSGKNLYDCNATTTTDEYGLTWTVDATDKNIITVSGTPTGFKAFPTHSNNVLPAGRYILSGIKEDTTNVALNYLGLRNGTTIVQELSKTLVGNEYYFNIPDNVVYDNLYVTLKRNDNNVACSGTVRLMVRKATILDPTYEPYRGTTAFPRDEQAVLGVKNLYPKYVGSRTDQNVTYTADETGVVSCVGVASNSALWRQDSLTLKAGKYILSGGEGIGTYNSSSFNALVGLYNPSTSAYIAPDTGTEDTYTFATDTVVQPTLRVQSGVDSSGYTFYPMLRLATDTDDTYVPYAMTNRELTENKVDKVGREITSSDNADNLDSAGRYYWKGTKPANIPTDASTYSYMEVYAGSGTIKQIIYSGTNTIYMRIKSGSPLTWKSWYKFEGTVVS